MAMATERRQRLIIFALHIGGLTAVRKDSGVGAAYAAADLVCADGVSVALLARARGARVPLLPTTDFGHSLISDFERELGRPPRVALLGGPVGLAETAGNALEATHQCEIVFVATGYHSSWQEVIMTLGQSNPDLVFVGLGSPFEQMWVSQHREALPLATIVTCGGWFGFLAGQESRAPRLVRRMKLEWAYRLALDPRRLASRYVRGAMTFVGLLLRR
jgi:exopolysaccharide biosynthesis WecB/TagA/CpsF family protein